MQLTHRERRGHFGLIALWGLLTVLCALTGPFGTFELMAPMLRTVYWAVVVAISIAGSVVISRSGPHPLMRAWIIWSTYTVVLALVVFALTVLTHPPFASWASFLGLMGRIGVSVAVINGLIYVASPWMGPAQAEKVHAPDGEARFLRRLPLEMRGPLVRIEAQDHYLDVTTSKGTSMILLRLAEAVEELADVEGLQTHRSHWVRLDAVTRVARINGRDMLVMSDGASVPVARTRRADAQAAGLL